MQEIDHSTEIEYGCVSGYTLKGNTRNTCINGNWQSLVPECKLLCPSADIMDVALKSECFVEVNNTMASIDCSKPVESNSIANIICQPGYEKRLITLTCGSDGRWCPPQPFCGDRTSIDSTILEPLKTPKNDLKIGKIK